MATFEVEAAFVGCFWRATQGDRQDDAIAANDAMIAVEPAAIEDRGLAALYALLRRRFAEGLPTDTADILGELEGAGVPHETAEAAMEAGISAAQLGYYAKVVQQEHRRARLLDMIAKARAYLEEGKGKDGGRRLAEELAMKALSLYAEMSDEGVPKTKDEILAEEIRLMEAAEEKGLTLPWPKLHKACGPWMPGDVIGVSAFSNAGKSTFAANLAFQFARRGVPFLVFPTEMRERWISRALCTISGVRQKVAEKRQWRTEATEWERDSYRNAIELSRRWPWVVVNEPNLSPVEILARTRVLRRLFDGRTVVVIVDHMHRLNYGGEDPNEAVGAATKMFKDFAGNDPAGLIFVLLYQPRKPESNSNTYRPIAGYQIRGNSMVWNELDVHLSPFRTWVKTDPNLGETAWNTPRTKCDPSGAPIMAKPNADGAKLSDEHYFLKVDKDRVGGEGPTIWLNFDAPSGCIYEEDLYWRNHAA